MARTARKSTPERALNASAPLPFGDRLSLTREETVWLVEALRVAEGFYERDRRPEASAGCRRMAHCAQEGGVLEGCAL